MRPAAAVAWAALEFLLTGPDGPEHDYPATIRAMSHLSSTFLPGDASLFQLLADHVQGYAVFALDPRGTVVSWNSGAERMNGYEASEIVGHSFARFFIDEDRAGGKPKRLLEDAAANGSSTDEGWRLRKDGSRFRASVLIAALRASDGGVGGFAQITREVTGSDAAEAALQLRERQLADTQELAELGSWSWEVETDTVSWTDQLYKLYGLDRGSFSATFGGYLERVHPDDRARVRALIEEAYVNGGNFSFEERIVRPDGAIRVLRSRGRALQDASGKTVRLMGACLDITDLKEAEAQASRLAAEQAARAALEAYAAGLRYLAHASELLSASLDYEQTLRTLAQLAVPEVADWCAVDLVEGENALRRVAVQHSDPDKIRLAVELSERFPPQRGAATGPWKVIDSGEPAYYPEISDEWLAQVVTDPEQLAIIRRLGLRSAITVPLSGRKERLGSLTLVQAESGRRFGEQDLRLMVELGRHAGLAIDNARLHSDLERQNELLEEQAAEMEQQTEELQNQALHLDELMAELEVTNEELLRRTEDAEAGNRAKADFLATMSHELRTPLNAIFGYADLLDLGIHGPVTPAQREALDRIKRNQRALLVLVNDVLNFAKLEAGKLELTLTDVTVAEVIAEVMAVVGPKLDSRGLRYWCEPFDAELRMRGEHERVEQILLNLLTNAAKFTPPGGEVVVGVDAEPDCVSVWVRDTGSGIPEERLQSVFDPFVQVDRQVEDNGERGVGLGLAISRDLAVAMGGTLSVASEVGEGSTFTLTLPCAGQDRDR